MTSSRRSKVAAIVVFLLVVVGVLGGMTWATLANLRLAELDVREEQRASIEGAAALLESYLPVMLKAEIGRAPTDYFAAHTVAPAAVFSDGEMKFDSEPVLMRSLIARGGPSKSWIEFYFQFDEDNKGWTTPQGYMPRLDEYAPFLLTNIQQGRMIQWIGKELPVELLVERFEESIDDTTTGPGDGLAAGLAPTTTEQANQGAGQAFGGQTKNTMKSRLSRKMSRLKASASSECLGHVIGDDSEFAAMESFGIHASSPYWTVGVYEDPMNAFWLTSADGQSKKLAFVRRAYKDATQLFQGFVCDWSELKKELLERIDHVLPRAELEPVEFDDVSKDPMDGSILLSVPVRLATPAFGVKRDDAVWDRIGIGLIATWSAAVFLLGVAGWGLKSLVALTERRMQFAYAVTHELRTPLTTFRLYSDMLSAGLVPESSRQEYLDTLNSESVRLTGLVEEVLEYARLENQNVKLIPIETDGESVLKTVAATLTERCEKTGVKPVSRNEVANGQSFCMDVDVVNRIVGVLVNNACRHARDSENATVVLTVSAASHRIFIDVVDTGPGIDRADARTIFRAFRRGRKAKMEARGGIGLGLALARNWASLLGGKLDLVHRCDPTYGGAHFRLSVPTSP